MIRLTTGNDTRRNGCPARPGGARAAMVATLLLIALLAAHPSGRVEGFSAEGLARVDSALARYVSDGKVAGAVLLVLKDGRLAFERAVGWADRDSGRRMGTDAIFRIASQTKAVTSAAVMMLADDGKLSLDDEVGEHLPSFAKATVALRTDTGMALAEAEDPVTIRHLLNHTAGISYGTDSLLAPLYAAEGLGPAAGFGWYTADKDEAICETMERLGRLPFAAQPGAAFVYGYSDDVLGCIVEKVSGMSLEEFFRQRITNPLRMHDTYFFLPAEKARRLATVYLTGEDGKAVRAPEGARGQGHYVAGPRRSFSGGAGLVSTARDYSRFLQMLLNGGELDGNRYLSKDAVKQMTTNGVGDLYNPGGLGFGFGLETVDREGALGAVPEGAYGWGGAYGSRYWVSPSDRVVVVLMFQLMPNGTDFRDVIPDLVFRALERPHD